MFGKVVVPALVLAAGALVPSAPSAAADTRAVPDCVDYAVDEGGADVGIAFMACTDDSVLGCYRIFRDQYGRQAWAVEACKARD
ncbi:hypothetical protein ALI144C_09960 [Actinosynnema sp. ALI-1.44]|uniref:hypothetical protein n=1 Tax=Actinosynnema sp. ALI-1.44 TaxID=1933779 RepID=UPI0009CEB7A8|nr:hypothetical protein [Actinosynnema sp. ALI-1.44]ONI86963.1 hypothetical protein ALI144C_09960 [Actinosynnema sp. ALI-1.44]